MIMMNEEEKVWPVIIIGGGPCGIAAGAELKKRGIESLIIEKGSVTESIRNYPKRMKFFSTAENIEIAGIPFATSNVKANRNEALQYYRKVALYFKLQFRLNCEVKSTEKKSDGLFSVKTNRGYFKAAKVILATGYFDLPRMLNIPGEEGKNVAHYYKEPYAHSFQNVTIIGGGNSAIEAALELYRHDVNVTMLVRGDDLKPTAKYWLIPDIKNRIKEGKIKLITNAVATLINESFVEYSKGGETHKLHSDFVYALTGYLPSEELMKKCGLNPDPDSLLVDYDKATFESPVEGLFMCGTVLAGVRTEKVFIENGRDHAIAIADKIASKESQPA